MLPEDFWLSVVIAITNQHFHYVVSRGSHQLVNLPTFWMFQLMLQLLLILIFSSEDLLWFSNS
jgi:hypothetical protein